jgi:RNA polymerase sigma-70 factor (ECF subfamily)
MWLFAIAKRVAADHLRRQNRRPRMKQSDDWVSVAERAGAAEPDHGRAVVLRQLITALDAERRDAFVLTQVLGLSYVETAEICGCAVGTVRSRIFRARQDLAGALADGPPPRWAASNA